MAHSQGFSPWVLLVRRLYVLLGLDCFVGVTDLASMPAPPNCCPFSVPLCIYVSKRCLILLPFFPWGLTGSHFLFSAAALIKNSGSANSLKLECRRKETGSEKCEIK